MRLLRHAGVPKPRSGACGLVRAVVASTHQHIAMNVASVRMPMRSFMCQNAGYFVWRITGFLVVVAWQ
jgi:hypothetical protein